MRHIVISNLARGVLFDLAVTTVTSLKLREEILMRHALTSDAPRETRRSGSTVTS